MSDLEFRFDFSKAIVNRVGWRRIVSKFVWVDRPISKTFIFHDKDGNQWFYQRVIGRLYKETLVGFGMLNE